MKDHRRLMNVVASFKAIPYPSEPQIETSLKGGRDSPGAGEAAAAAAGVEARGRADTEPEPGPGRRGARGARVYSRVQAAVQRAGIDRRAERGARAARGRARGGARARRPPVRLGAASARSSPVPVLRRAGVSPRAPGGGGEPRAARPRADAAAGRSRSAPHPAPAAAARRRRRRARSHAAQPPPAPRLRPVFLWAIQLDGAVQRVDCEDYDPRNRIHLTRTESGWQAFPRTPRYDSIRRDRATRRRRPVSPAPDLESHIPSHRIAVPRAPSPPAARPPPPEPTTPTTPLDSLLAVAEFALHQQNGTDAMDASGPRFAFLPPEETADELFDLGADDGKTADGDDAFRDDLFETISDAHYLLPPALESHEDELLESLVEKGCEDNQILDRLSAQLAGGAHYEDALLADAPVADIIGRLESLESPSRSAAQGLLHLSRRPSVADPFAPEPAPATDPPPPDLMFPERMPDVFDYEDYEIACSSASEVRSDGPTTSSEEKPVVAFEKPETTTPIPEVSPISKLRDVKLDIINSGIEIDFQLGPGSESKIESLKKEIEKPTDLSVVVELEPEEPAPAAPPAALDHTYNEATGSEPADKADDLPKDLSMHRRVSSSYASPRRIEIPRAPSRESDAMQSPQPSGIPAISSPEVFSASSGKNCRPSPFLESLYASTSPKMYTSEVSIQQCVPLNLGKHRKSASPTVSSCSDDIRTSSNREHGEPQEKRARREPHDLAKICNLLKKCGEDKLAEAKQKKLSEIEQLPPLKQLELLKSNKNFNLPEHMLVPRNRLNNIIAAPGREIPALLMERPQLNMTEILQDPNFIGDPELMVISLEQIRQLIIHKPTEGGRRPGSAEPAREPPPRPAGRPASPRPATPRPASAERTATPRAAAALLADEIDAANAAAAYQMNWLPAMYLSRMSQLEAAAACAQNAEFLKALGSAGYGGAGHPGLPQMFHPARYGPPAAPAMSPLEFAMWQEAMSAMQRRKRPEPKEAEPYAASRGRRAERTPPPPPAPAYRAYPPPPPGLHLPRAPPPRPAEGSPRPRISVKSLQELQHAAQGSRRPARRRDEPEVGSTTSAGEAPPPPHQPHHPPHPHPHPHDPAAYALWHPLFSNQKGYPSPWSWPVTATGD